VIDRFHVDPKKVITIPNAIDPSRMKTARGRTATRQALGIPESALVLLSLGALTWEKSPLTHVEVGAGVTAEFPEALHLIVGDGPLRPAVERAILEREGTSRIRVLGNRSDVGDVLAASDVLLLASETEGMPAVAIEAGIARLPVVAYGLAGIPEVVLDGITGCLVPPGHVAGLRDAVVRLFRDAALRRAMGEAAQERCLELFDISAIAPRYLALYEELVP